MNGMKILALLLIAGGIAGLAYGGFTYTKDTQAATLGPIQLTVKDQRRVNVPVWAGVVVIVIGTGLLLVPARKT